MKTRWSLLVLCVSFVAAFLPIACGRSEAAMSAPNAEFARMEDAAGGMAKDVAPEARAMAAPAPVSPATPQPASQSQASEGRKLVYNADLRLEVKQLPDSERSVLAAIQSAGGYVQYQTASENSVYMTARLPVAALESLMDTVAGAGKVLTRSMSADDVTDQFYDMEGRLRNKRILEERYREYLKKAATVSDMLDVEARLSDTTNEIEWLEGSFRDLGKRIELATLNIELVPVRASDPSKPSIGEAIAKLFAGVGDVFRSLLVIIIGIVVYGIPAILVLAGLWYLSFGKLGLVRKLFALVRGKKS